MAQAFIDKHLNRPVAVDGSLMGMGRIPGNLPIELIADYCNDYTGKTYDIDYLMDAIQDYIAPLKGEPNWGYTPAYFLSARFNLHRNYAEHYLKKGDLTIREINHILARFDDNKKTAFDESYADSLYENYKNNQIDDSNSRTTLHHLLSGKNVLLIAPGSSIVTYKEKIDDFVKQENPVIISINFVPELYNVDFAFFSNNKRFSNLENVSCKTIITSNLLSDLADFKIDYNSLSGAFDQGCNSFIMILKLLKEMNTKAIFIAGADGYTESGKNYYKSNIRTYTKHGNKFNMAVANAVRNLDLEVTFLTPSAYETERNEKR